jgi:hypothetical protein
VRSSTPAIGRARALGVLAGLLPGMILLAGFIPQHISLWDRFPVWYHLTFLLSLIPLTYLGGGVRRGRRDVDFGDVRSTS